MYARSLVRLQHSCPTSARQSYSLNSPLTGANEADLLGSVFFCYAEFGEDGDSRDLKGFTSSDYGHD